MKNFKVFDYKDFVQCGSLHEIVEQANNILNALSVSTSDVGERVVNFRDYTGWKKSGDNIQELEEHIAKGGQAYEAMVIGIRPVKTKTEIDK